MFVDEWRSHEDTAELSGLLSASVDQMEPHESDCDDGSASSGSEQSGDEDQSNDDDDDGDDDKVSFPVLSSTNPFELLTDDN